MDDRLVNIYSTLLSIEVHGQSVLMLADCIRALRQVIDEEQNQMNPKYETVSEGTHE